MAKKAMILKQQAEAKYSTAATTAARSAAGPTPTCGITAYAGSASGNWPIRRDSRRPEGQLVTGGFSPAASRRRPGASGMARKRL